MVKIKSGFKKRNFHHVCILYAPSHLTTTCIIHMSIEIKYCEGKKEKIERFPFFVSSMWKEEKLILGVRS